LSLMNMSFPLPPCLSHPPQPQQCIHLLCCLANFKMLHIRLCCCLIMVQELDEVPAWNFSRTHPFALRCPTLIRCMCMPLVTTIASPTPPSAPRQHPRLGRCPQGSDRLDLRPPGSHRLGRRPHGPARLVWRLPRLPCRTIRLGRLRPRRQSPLRQLLHRLHLRQLLHRPQCLLLLSVRTPASAVALSVTCSALMALSPIWRPVWLKLWLILLLNLTVIKLP
jgi:hypothetical protein